MDSIGGKNPVSVLMEYAQRNSNCRLNFYDYLKTLGPSHTPRFLCVWKVNSDYAIGVFYQNKKEGKNISALLALKHLEAVEDIGFEIGDTTDIEISESLTIPVLTSSVDGIVRNGLGLQSPNIHVTQADSSERQSRPAFSILMSQSVDSSPSMNPPQNAVSSSNPISILHEIGQKLGYQPQSSVVELTGQAHDPTFTVRCTFGDISHDVKGKNKADAKRLAFEQVLQEVKDKYPDYFKLAPSASPKKFACASGLIQDPAVTSSASPAVSSATSPDGKNPVSEVMEMGNKLGIIPQFPTQELYSIPGPKRFQCECTFGEDTFEPGYGANKKEAKLAAAKIALKTLKITFDGRFSAQKHCISSPDYEDNLYRNNTTDATSPFDRAAVETLLNQKNPISALNEKAQKEKVSISWEEVQSSGPAHCKRFEIRCIFNNIPCPSAIDKTKSDAKKKAAELALCQLLSEQLQISPRNASIVVQPTDESPMEMEWDQPNYVNSSDRLSSRSAQPQPLPSLPSVSMLSAGPKSLVGPEYDIIASEVLKKFEELKRSTMWSFGKLVLAGFVLEIESESKSDYQCVSIGTGNTVIGGGKLTTDGDVVHDSHAEIVARRGLLRFLYNQILAHDPGSATSIYDRTEGGRLKLKDSHSFHLYISTAPCGDGAVFSHSSASTSASGSRGVMKPGEHKPNMEPKEAGILRCKIEEGQGTVKGPTTTQTFDGIHLGNKLYTMSCSDKICKWNVMGVQGTLLSYLIDPIYIKTIVLGQLYNAGHLSRALCCRLKGFTEEIKEMTADRYKLNHPTIALAGAETNRSSSKTKELSFNWSLPDESEEIVEGPSGRIIQEGSSIKHSRISRKELFKMFRECCLMLDRKDLKDQDYITTKANISQYTELKKKLYEKFQSLGYSVWVQKPAEVSEFNL